MSYLIFVDVAAFDEWHSRINAALGYPDEETKTKQYTIPVIHPDDGRAAAVVMTWLETRLSRSDEPLLAEGETAERVAELTPDWWPDEDEEAAE